MLPAEVCCQLRYATRTLYTLMFYLIAQNADDKRKYHEQRDKTSGTVALTFLFHQQRQKEKYPVLKSNERRLLKHNIPKIHICLFYLEEKLLLRELIRFISSTEFILFFTVCHEGTMRNAMHCGIHSNTKMRGQL